MLAATDLFAAEHEAIERGLPVEEVLGEHERIERARRAHEMNRRELLAAATGIAGTVAMANPALSFARSLGSKATPRIAIVGSGLAGLRCAHQLWNLKPRRPIASTIFEANPERIGGRCWSLRDYFSNGLITEHGGSFINTNQRAVRHLARSLGLTLEEVNGGNLFSGEEVYWIDGASYTNKEALADWQSVGYRTFRSALREAKTPAGKKLLDSMSVTEWLEGSAIGTTSRFGKLMLACTVAEQGGDPEDQSALLLIEEFGFKKSTTLTTGEGDERFHITGGNDQLVTGMLAQLPPETVQLGHKLVALQTLSNGSFKLVLDVAGSTVESTADVVVLALPFATLREVDLSKSGLSSTKRHVIETMGMGTNAKIHLELGRATWPAAGYSGDLLTEWEGLCCGWDDSVPLGADASPLLYLGYPGGRVGRDVLTGAAHGPAPSKDVTWMLSQMDQLFPGTTAAYAGRAYEDHWSEDPYTNGAYSFWAVGQASNFGELAGTPEGSILFAGEHTSVENEGYLDGAVETGERAANEIRKRL
ncbi:MAG TPA: NAD(P)/FAD-dependent oxidoreductase [Solirubrobacteraceae bacterium]|jgi:monoamine oxidase|nr:NAD(P)/FAD-dependent oxidoreductase [Solirubrobacteraceae bacterium]